MLLRRRRRHGPHHLAPAGPAGVAVQLSYSLAVVLTFPLQAFPALELLAPRSRRTDAALRRNAMASMLVATLAVLAWRAMDRLEYVVSLMGASVGMPLMLVFPSLLHVRLTEDASPRRKGMNYLVAGFGGAVTVAASTVVVLSWARDE